MWYLWGLVAGVVGGLLILNADETICQIELNSQVFTNGVFEPLLYSRTTDTLALPEDDGALHLHLNEELLVACAGSELVHQGTPTALLKCKCNGALELAGRRINSLVDLRCRRRVPGSLMVTRLSCAEGKGVSIDIGFEVSKDPHQIYFNEIFTVCHDIGKADTLYASHIFNGKISNTNVRPPPRPKFSRGDSSLYQGFDPDTAYSQRNQEDRFSTELGQRKAAEYLRPRECLYLARGHLAPAADFTYWQSVSYLFVNAVPMWQSINNGHWGDKGIEGDIRRLARSKKASFEIVTGTSGILSLEGDNGIRKPIFLQRGNKIPVPEHVWKFVRDPATSACIVFVVINNPHITARQHPPLWCEDICARNHWPLYQSNYKKGFVYCCDANYVHWRIGLDDRNKCRAQLVNR